MRNDLGMQEVDINGRIFWALVRKKQIATQLEYANSVGKTSEFWFKYWAHRRVVNHITKRGSIVRFGLNNN